MELAYRKTARQYYGDPLLSNLLNAVFKKYQGQSGVRGNAEIKASSPAEAQRLQNYFGNRVQRLIHPGAELHVPLKIFAEELQQGYKLTIPDLYEVLNNEPLLTKVEQKQLKEAAWTHLFEQVSLDFEREHGFTLDNTVFCQETFNWFERLKKGSASGYRVLKSALRNGEDACSDLYKCIKALWHLFVGREIMFKELSVCVNRVRIPMFADHVTNDPHAFDWKMTAGRLLWYALNDIDNQMIKTGRKTASDMLVVPEYMQKRQIYRNFGLMDDDISSFSHVFAPHFTSGISPRTLNLSEILSYGKFPVYSVLYAFENPSVLSYLVDEIVQFLDLNGLSFEQIPEKFPALLCTSGQSRSAALAFITRCLNSNPDCMVYYSGDLDLPGLQMMWGIQARFSVNFQAGRMNVSTYRKLSDSAHLPFSVQDIKILKKSLDDLPKVMVGLGVKVYQEEFAKDLKKDVMEVICREIEK
ncbi:TIGR02679 domain-containing protein [Desulfosporosinus sp. SB140]|uniref:TIGR02679 domain-containing protein n=1 Tax=Desulfosporosinus paludis TaxID=3115649 RepID=UPI00388FCCFE